MIIAGVFQSTNKNIFKKLEALVKQDIKKDITYFENHYIQIIIGKTSETIDQGRIFKTEDSLLLGKVYRKDNYKAITEKDFIQQSKKSNKSFVNSYWGNYLFINSSDDDQTITILRDPIGQLPIFYSVMASGEIIFSSEIEIVHHMIKRKLVLNWAYLLAYIKHGSITTRYTAFESIYELPHGCELAFDCTNNTILETVIWNPLDYCKNYVSPQQTQRDIINTATKVIKAWTQNTDGVFLDFSGGTDSTGLLFLLHKLLNKNQVLKPVNVFHNEALSSDERKFAAKIADEIGINLTYFDRSKILPLDPIIEAQKLKPNWPTSTLAHLRVRQDMDDLSKGYKNIVHISGHGGDHVFMCPTPIESLCDYLIDHCRKGFFSKLVELSTMYRKPLLAILKDIFSGFLDYFLRPNYNYFRDLIKKNSDTAWFKKESCKIVQQITYHPFFYLKHKARILPGKLKHIEAIYRGLATIKKDIRDGNTNPVFYPLISQPILELALSIPTYESFQAGYNRYPFRKAISDAFKTNSVWRQDKGDTSGIMQRGLKKNRHYILDLCTEGHTVQMGLIDKKILYREIQELLHGKVDNQWPIINLICVEKFIKLWNLDLSL